MQNWLRDYRLVAGPEGGTGFEIGEEKDGRAIHISFSCEKSDGESNNDANITIWNLTEEHKAILKQAKCGVEIRAGYGGNRALVFKGTVSEAYEEMDGSDRSINLTVVDGKEVNAPNVTVSMNGEITCMTVAADFVTKLGIPSCVYSPKATEKLNATKYDNGFAFVGRAKDGLTNVLTKCALKYSIQNGVMQVYEENEPITQQADVLNKESGLIGIPKKVKIDKSSKTGAGTSGTDNKTDNTQTGYEVQYLMNGAIGVNDLVNVVSKEITGTYRVKSIKIDGDNYSGDWLCTAQILEA